MEKRLNKGKDIIKIMMKGRTLKAIGVLAALGVGAVFAQGKTLDAVKNDIVKGPSEWKIVLGQDAKVIDVIGAVDIANALAYHNKQVKTIDLSQVKIELEKETAKVAGEIPLYKDTAKLYLGDKLNQIVPRVEYEKGTFVDRENNKYDYIEYVVPGENVSIIYKDRPDTDNVDPVVMVWNDTTVQPLYLLEVQFTGVLNSTKVVAKPIKLFGKTYYFHKDTDFNSGKWVLVEAAKDVTLGVGDSIEFEGHSVKLVDVVEKQQGKYAAIVKVDEITKTVDVGSTDTINGIDIYVVDAYVSKTQAGKAYAEIVIGGKKVEISQTTGYVKVGDKELRNVRVLKATNTTLQLAVYKNYDDNTKNYLEAGEEFVDPLFGTFKLVFKPAGLTEGKEKVELVPVTSAKYQLRISDFRGNHKSIDLLKWDSNNNITLLDGKFKGTIIGSGSQDVTLARDEYVVLYHPTYKESYLLRLVDIDTTNGKAIFEDVFTGTRYEVLNNTQLVVGPFSIKVQVSNNNVTLQNVASSSNFQWWTDNEASLNVSLANNNTIAQVTINYNPTGVTKNDIVSFNIYYDSANQRLDVNLTTVGGLESGKIIDSDNHMLYALGDAGVFLKIVNTDQQDKVELYIPKEPQYYEISIEPVETEVVTKTKEVGIGGEIDGWKVKEVMGIPEKVETVAPLVGVAVLDTEVTPGMNKLIVVGGPAVNRIAADFLAAKYPELAEKVAGKEKYSGEVLQELGLLAPNESIIEVAEMGGQVAVLVYGWSGEDTRRAARAFALYLTEGKFSEAFEGATKVRVGGTVETPSVERVQ